MQWRPALTKLLLLQNLKINPQFCYKLLLIFSVGDKLYISIAVKLALQSRIYRDYTVQPCPLSPAQSSLHDIIRRVFSVHWVR